MDGWRGKVVRGEVRGERWEVGVERGDGWDGWGGFVF